jgi:leucyl aminopeptidase
VLGDALSYVQKEYSPKKIIDVATLTGACMGKASPCMIVAAVLSH